MSKLQSKQEEYAKNKKADIIYRIITNKPKSPKKDSKISPKKDLPLELLRSNIIENKKLLLLPERDIMPKINQVEIKMIKTRYILKMTHGFTT